MQDYKFLKYYENRMITTSRNRKLHCNFIHGDYDEKTRLCTQYYWAEEMCVSIGKNNQTGEWTLQGTRYRPDSWGCAFKPKDHPSYMLQWDSVRNMKVVWQKMFMSRRKTADFFFPLKHKPVQFHIRHAGDPLLAALDINKNLNFGLSSEEKEAQGVVLLVFSLIILFCGVWRAKTVVCPSYDMFKNTSQALFDRDLKKYQQRISKYKTADEDDNEKWKNPAIWRNDQPPLDDFHNLQEE